jgi:hypothetical protein
MSFQLDIIAPAPTPDNGNFGGSLTEVDIALLAEAAARIAAKIALHNDRPVLLFIGVGTGNPLGSPWGNPTNGGKGGITDQQQRSPGVLADAERKGYYVIAANFNYGSGDIITEQDDASFFRIFVPARFPLVVPGPGAAKEAFDALRGAAQAATRFAILNAVTQVDYAALLMLANAKKNGESSYMKSYMQTGETSAYSPINPKMGAYNEGSSLATMADVFYRDFTETQ